MFSLLAAAQNSNIKACWDSQKFTWFFPSTSSMPIFFRLGWSFVYSLIVIIHIFSVDGLLSPLFNCTKNGNVSCASLATFTCFFYYYWIIDIRWFVLSVRFRLSHEFGVAIFMIIFLFFLLLLHAQSQLLILTVELFALKINNLFWNVNYDESVCGHLVL